MSSRRRRSSRYRRRRRMIRRRIACIVLIIVAVLAILGVVHLLKPVIESKIGQKNAGTKSHTEQQSGITIKDDDLVKYSYAAGNMIEEKAADLLANRADIMAAQYNYDAAIDILNKAPMQVDNKVERIERYEKERDSCVEWDVTETYHIFFHTLVYDTSLAFDGDENEAGYNQVMTTVDEFNKMIEIMYERGYVLVSLHDLAKMETDADGNEVMTKQTIMLPPGKKAMVVSQDDVSYYHYMDGDGMATKLIIDENGEVKNEYLETDGTISVGDYDMVPLLDSFVQEHPDFSYRGAKGILALTGYNGVLGYRTDIAYKTRENLDRVQELWFEEHPDFDEEAWNNEVAEATKVADAMKATGWEFASHTWGHQNVGTASLEKVKTDAEKWMTYVSPILGGTDVIIFAFGSDLGDWHPYTMDNEKFAYFKSIGFNYFCNVDGSNKFMQITDDAFRMGRWNLDGYRMYYYPEKLTDLFDVEDVWDSARPTPVPPM